MAIHIFMDRTEIRLIRLCNLHYKLQSPICLNASSFHFNAYIKATEYIATWSKSN
jgi:hypothetical protein